MEGRQTPGVLGADTLPSPNKLSPTPYSKEDGGKDAFHEGINLMSGQTPCQTVWRKKLVIEHGKPPAGDSLRLRAPK